jgi:hypothetical protein
LQLGDVNHVVFNKKRHISHGDRFAAVFAFLKDQDGDRRTPMRRAPLLSPGKKAQAEQKPIGWPSYYEFSILPSGRCSQHHPYPGDPIALALLFVALKVFL